MSKTPHHIDRHVGQRIRARRMAQGLSQEALGKHLGLTFQQVQKYEKGSNRVSASRLAQIAFLLEAPVAHFFSGLPEDGSAPSAQQLQEGAFLGTKEGIEIAGAWPQLDERARQSVLGIVRAIAGAAAIERAAA